MGFGASRFASTAACGALILSALPAFAQHAPRGAVPPAPGVPVELVSTDPSMHLRLTVDWRDRRHIERLRLAYPEYPAEIPDDPVPFVQCRGVCGTSVPPGRYFFETSRGVVGFDRHERYDLVRPTRITFDPGSKIGRGLGLPIAVLGTTILGISSIIAAVTLNGGRPDEKAERVMIGGLVIGGVMTPAGWIWFATSRPSVTVEPADRGR